jgi:CxxC motif-containing protein (DUF1111 family)
VTAGPSQITEIRAGHRDENGNFVNPSVSINDGANVICPQAQEHLPESENVRSLRAVLNTLGDGFVEAVDDSILLAIADSQPDQSHGLIRGEAIQVPILEAPGQTRVGRFGWKDQHGSLLCFAADAYVNEMGVTSRLRMVDPTCVCKVTSDPEDRPDALGLADIDHFAQFVRGTKVPPRDTLLATTPDAMAGQKVLESIGCNICHVESMTTAPQRTPVNGGMFLVPEALGYKIIHPFGDFLLHQIGTGDGIVQVGLEDTAAKLRTAPLWGLRTKSRFTHDLASLTLEDAIYRHRGEARRVAHDFRALPSVQQQQLIRFLKSL